MYHCFTSSINENCTSVISSTRINFCVLCQDSLLQNLYVLCGFNIERIVGWTTRKMLPFCFSPILIMSCLHRRDTRFSPWYIFAFRGSLGMRLVLNKCPCMFESTGMGEMVLSCKTVSSCLRTVTVTYNYLCKQRVPKCNTYSLSKVCNSTLPKPLHVTMYSLSEAAFKVVDTLPMYPTQATTWQHIEE